MDAWSPSTGGGRSIISRTRRLVLGAIRVRVFLTVVPPMVRSRPSQPSGIRAEFGATGASDPPTRASPGRASGEAGSESWGSPCIARTRADGRSTSAWSTGVFGFCFSECRGSISDGFVQSGGGSGDGRGDENGVGWIDGAPGDRTRDSSAESGPTIHVRWWLLFGPWPDVRRTSVGRSLRTPPVVVHAEISEWPDSHRGSAVFPLDGCAAIWVWSRGIPTRSLTPRKT